MARLESKFQSELRKELESMFPGCLIIKGNSASVQGVPDWLILWHDRWAALEVKRSAEADHQPNQDWYVDLLDEWSFSAFIYPENKEDVLDALQRSFTARRSSRVPKR